MHSQPQVRAPKTKSINIQRNVLCEKVLRVVEGIYWKGKVGASTISASINIHTHVYWTEGTARSMHIQIYIFVYKTHVRANMLFAPFIFQRKNVKSQSRLAFVQIWVPSWVTRRLQRICTLRSAWQLWMGGLWFEHPFWLNLPDVVCVWLCLVEWLVSNPRCTQKICMR